MYKLYGTRESRAMRVLWLLEELGQPYEQIDAGPRDPRVTALNGTGKVPVLETDDGMLSDSTAIMTYLADRHGGLTHPAGSIERAQQDSLLHLILDEIEAPLWLGTRHMAILPEDQRVPAILPALMADFSQGMERLESRLQGPFLQGETMTIADILATHCMSWARFVRFPAISDTMLDYSKRLRARPAFKAAAES